MQTNLITCILDSLTTAEPRLKFGYCWLDEKSVRFDGRIKPQDTEPVIRVVVRTADFGREVFASLLVNKGNGTGVGQEIPFQASASPPAIAHHIAAAISQMMVRRESVQHSALDTAFVEALQKLVPIYRFTLNSPEGVQQRGRVNATAVTSPRRDYLPSIYILSCEAGIEVSAVTADGEIVGAVMLPPQSTPPDVALHILNFALARTLTNINAAKDATASPPRQAFIYTPTIQGAKPRYVFDNEAAFLAYVHAERTRYAEGEGKNKAGFAPVPFFPPAPIPLLSQPPTPAEDAAREEAEIKAAALAKLDPRERKALNL